jgi:hypothetical protein
VVAAPFLEAAGQGAPGTWKQALETYRRVLTTAAREGQLRAEHLNVDTAGLL